MFSRLAANWRLSAVGLAALASSSLWTGMASAAVHSKDCFEPDYVLVATEEDIQIDCQTRHSVVVNGTFPGPPVELHENRTTWIRVYNNMDEQNFTMVRAFLLLCAREKKRARKHSFLLA